MFKPLHKLSLAFDNKFSKIYSRHVGKYPIHENWINPLRMDQVPLPLNVRNLNESHWIKGCYSKRVNSHEFAVEYVEKGSMRFASDQDDHTIQMGEIFFVHIGADTIMTPGREKFCIKKGIVGGGFLLETVLASLKLKDVSFIRPKSPSSFTTVFEQIKQEIVEKRDGAQVRVSALFYQVLLMLSQEHNQKRYPVLLVSTLAFLEHNIANKLTLDDICRSMGTSPATLNRAFKQNLQTSPMDYFIKMKMDYAAQLLEHTDLSIKEISQHTGYANQLYFSGEFRKRQGVSPRQYRQREAF